MDCGGGEMQGGGVKRFEDNAFMIKSKIDNTNSVVFILFNLQAGSVFSFVPVSSQLSALSSHAGCD